MNSCEHRHTKWTGNMQSGTCKDCGMPLKDFEGKVVIDEGRIIAALTDAARWRAVINSGRIRYLGSAGLHTDLDPYGNPWNGYAHIGLELWTKHEAGHEPSNAVAMLTKYADIARGV